MNLPDVDLFDLSIPRDPLVDLTGGVLTLLPFHARAVAALRGGREHRLVDGRWRWVRVPAPAGAPLRGRGRGR